MGKGNRNENYQETYSMSKNAAKGAAAKKDRTSAIMIAVIAVILIAAVALTFITSNGLIERRTTIVSSENYEVTASMIPYFESLAYSSTFSQYYSLYYSYLGDATSAYSYAQNIMSQYSLSDFFSSALATAKELLILCEGAKENGLTLDDEDLASIEETLAQYEGNYSSIFGLGVKEADIRKSVELSALASKYYEMYEKDVTDKITDADIEEYVNNNKSSFFNTKYAAYEIALKAADYATTEEFEADKALADSYVEALSSATSLSEFKTAVVNYVVEKNFNTAKSKADESITEDQLATIKSEITAELIAQYVTENFKEAEAEESAYTTSKKAIKTELTSKVQTAMSSLESTQAYSEEATDEAIKWLIGESATENATKVIISSTDSQYSKKVYFVTSPLQLDKSITQNVGHILIEAKEGTATEDEIAAAKAKAEMILAEYLAGEKTKESFETLGKANTADSNVFYNNVTEGKMVQAFNDWIFDETRKEGDTGIVQSEYGFHVMYYVGNQMQYIANAKAAILSETYSEYLKEKTELLKLNDKAIEKYTPAQAETE